MTYICCEIMKRSYEWKWDRTDENKKRITCGIYEFMLNLEFFHKTVWL